MEYRQPERVFFYGGNNLSEIEEKKFDEWYLKDFWAVAYLKLCQIEPIRIERSQNGKRIWFFENNDNLHPKIQEYYDNEGLRAYVKACNTVKAQMYDKQVEPKNGKKDVWPIIDVISGSHH